MKDYPWTQADQTPEMDAEANMIGETAEELFPLDKCGQVIRPGSYIVYGHALGRSVGLKFGKVIHAQRTFATYGSDARIEVIGVDDGWKGHPALLTHKGILRYGNRVIVLPFKALPYYAQELLKEI